MRSIVLMSLFAATIGILPNNAEARRNDSAGTVLEAESQAKLNAAIDDCLKQLNKKDYKAALAGASELPVPDTDQGRSLKLSFQAAALVGLGRVDEGQRAFAQADALWPDSPGTSTFQYEMGLATNQHAVAATAVDRMIERFPDVARGLDYNNFRWFLWEDGKLKTKASEDRVIALVRLGYGANKPHADHLAFSAVKYLMKRGDVGGAMDLLSYIDDPELIEDLLIMKKYAGLWPKAQELAGPHLEKILKSYVANAERDLAAEPESKEALAGYASALREAGRSAEAVALKAKLPATRDAMAKADERTGWAINAVAYALHDLNRADEADALFALLNDGPEPSDNWRVSMKINRLGLLAQDGRFDRAMPLVEPTAKVPGSDYAKQLVRSLRICTLAGLGRKKEAELHIAELTAHAKDSYMTTVEGLVCVGDMDGAERLILTALKDGDDFHADFVRSFQAKRLNASEKSVWDKSFEDLRKRPAIMKEFDRLGRNMPEEFLRQRSETGG